MTNSPRNVFKHVASDRKNDMKASKERVKKPTCVDVSRKTKTVLSTLNQHSIFRLLKFAESLESDARVLTGTAFRVRCHIIDRDAGRL
jgi:hypothetical protein